MTQPSGTRSKQRSTQRGAVLFGLAGGMLVVAAGMLGGYYVLGTKSEARAATSEKAASAAEPSAANKAPAASGTLAAFLGNVVGYEIGRAIGAPLYNREGRFIKRKHFEQTSAFFDKYGNRALVLGRFVPIVRTFITVVAGISRMDRRRFFTYSAVGAVLWATGVTLLGYYLGQIEFVKANIEVALILIVFVSVLPMLFEYVAHRRRAKAMAEEVIEAVQDSIALRESDPER